MDVMDLIEKEAVLSPVQVISILAINPKLPLSVAAGYISNTLKVNFRFLNKICFRFSHSWRTCCHLTYYYFTVNCMYTIFM